MTIRLCYLAVFITLATKSHSPLSNPKCRHPAGLPAVEASACGVPGAFRGVVGRVHEVVGGRSVGVGGHSHLDLAKLREYMPQA